MSNLLDQKAEQEYRCEACGAGLRVALLTGQRRLAWERCQVCGGKAWEVVRGEER